MLVFLLVGSTGVVTGWVCYSLYIELVFSVHLYLEKNSLHHMVFSCLLKSYGPNLQNDTKLETTSCFIAEKMALDEPLFCTGSLWEAF